MAHLLCLFILFVAWPQGTLAEQPRRYDTPLSNILLVDGIGIHRNSSQNRIHRNLPYNSYTVTTYNLTEVERKTLKLSCISDSPNSWKWTTAEDPKIKHITKERRLHANVTESSLFLSNLTIYMNSTMYPIEINFTCVHSQLDTKSKIWKDQLVVCVEIISLGYQPQKLKVFNGIPIKACLLDRGGAEVYYHIEAAKCTNELTVDLDTLKGSCKKYRHSGGIASKYCTDLDSCENLQFSFLFQGDDFRCLKNKGEYRSISKNNTDYDDVDTLTNGKLHPLYIYCKRAFDNTWSAFLPAYPSVNLRGKSWTELTYYKTVKEARHHNSLQLFVLPYGQDTLEGIISSQYTRAKFAVGETVTFVCVAVKYLYMLGFQWSVNGRTLNESPKGATDLNTALMYADSRIVLMNQTFYGSHVRVSCYAPVWNSVDFVSTTKNVSLYSAKSPHTELLCKGNDVMKNCSCVYFGWPQPTIKWKEPSFLTYEKPQDKPEADTYDDTINPNEMQWTSYRTYMKPEYASSLQIVIECVANNFQGQHKSTFKESTDDGVSLPLIISASVLSILAAIIIVVFVYLRHIKVKKYLTKEEVNHFHNGKRNLGEDNDEAYEDCSALSFPNAYKFSKRDITVGSIIGRGEFGMVYEGILSNRGKVAVKIPISTGDENHFKSALSELKILSYIGSHSYVVSLMGAYVAEIEKGKLYIVLEFCENGSLINHLRRMQKQQTSDDEEFSINLYDLYRFSYEIACGMEYIAGKRVIHGDLAARNVLLTDEYTCKIADFGLSRKLYAYNEYVKKSHEPLPWRWMAPESLRNMEFTTKSDVWSYGVTVWEIFSLGTLPYPGLSWSVEFVNELDSGLRLGKAQYSSDEMHEKLLGCFHKNPDERPCFAELANYFATQKESVYLHLDEA